MQSHRKTIFISDLHLQKKHIDSAEWFLYLLSQLPGKADALYILGDLFEAWVGDDDNDPFVHDIIAALKAATQNGLAIYYLHGNRDFLIGKKFLKATGCVLLKEEQLISVYGTPLLLMHGDLLCGDDFNYLRFRKVIRQPILHKIYLLLPLYVRKTIAKFLRNQSSRYTAHLPLQKMDVTTNMLQSYLSKYKTSHILHGHTHQPAIHNEMLNDRMIQRIVLGAWHDHANMLVWDAAGHKRLIDFNLQDKPLDFDARSFVKVG